MDIKGFDHVNLSVRDFDASVDWYGRVFHFSLVEEGVSDGVRWGILRAGDSMLCIYEYPEREFVDRHELKARGIHGINHLGFRIEDEQEWLKTMKRENVHASFWDWPHSRAWYVCDPTGYEIEVAYWKNGVVFDGATA